MAYQIIGELCANCGACELECPNQAISMDRFTYVIDADKCSECEGFHDEQQCAKVCPIPGVCVPIEAAATASA